MTTFIDGIVLTQKHYHGDGIKELAGIRYMQYREAGDINRAGEEVEEQEIIGDNSKKAWIQGSHNTAIQVGSQGGLVSLSGNPGRWSRSDNVFNLDLDGTVRAANFIMRSKGLPDFVPGEPIATAAIGPVLTAEGFIGWQRAATSLRSITSFPDLTAHSEARHAFGPFM